MHISAFNSISNIKICVYVYILPHMHTYNYKHTYYIHCIDVINRD